MTRLQKILISSKAAKLKAVRRVTQDNLGKKTAGVDNVKNIEPKNRLKLMQLLHGHCHKIKTANDRKN